MLIFFALAAYADPYTVFISSKDNGMKQLLPSPFVPVYVYALNTRRVSNLVPRDLWLFGQRVGARLIGCPVMACIILPKKSCGNKIPVPQSLSWRPTAGRGVRDCRVSRNEDMLVRIVQKGTPFSTMSAASEAQRRVIFRRILIPTFHCRRDKWVRFEMPLSFIGGTKSIN